MSSSLDPDQARHSVRPNLDPNYLQRSAADDKICSWQADLILHVFVLLSADILSKLSISKKFRSKQFGSSWSSSTFYQVWSRSEQFAKFISRQNWQAKSESECKSYPTGRIVYFYLLWVNELGRLWRDCLNGRLLFDFCLKPRGLISCTGSYKDYEYTFKSASHHN